MRTRTSCTLAGGLIVLLSLLAPKTAAAAITLGPTIDLPWSQVDFLGGTVAVLADGSFAIAGYRYDLNSFQVQFFSAKGDLLPPVLLQPPVGSTEPTYYIGVGSLGTSYLVLWQDYGFSISKGYHAIRHAYGQLFSEKGTLLGSQFLWPSSGAPDFAEFYHFGSAPRWRFLAVTYDLISNDVDRIYRASLRLAKPDEVSHRPPIELGPPVVSNVEDAAINGNGRFVVVSDQCASYPPPSPPCVRGIQIFDDGMRPLTPFLTAGIEQDNSAVGSGVLAAINAQGRVLLNFVNSADRLVARLYDESGSPASGDILVNAPQEPFESYVGEMKGLDDGSFVFAWSVFRILASGAHGEELVLSRFDPSAGRLEEPVIVDTPSYFFRSAVLKLNGHGQGVVVWQNSDGAGFPGDAHFRLIRVAP